VKLRYARIRDTRAIYLQQEEKSTRENTAVVLAGPYHPCTEPSPVCHRRRGRLRYG